MGIIGDSVTSGMSGDVVGDLKDVCQVQSIIGCDVAGDAREGPCWNVSSASPFGEKIAWDVIHFNEGLHSLWPRVNTTAELTVWAEQLFNFTRMMQRTNPEATLIYATMTPFMPEKFALETVKKAGVTRINDLYSVITDKCGKVYKT